MIGIVAGSEALSAPRVSMQEHRHAHHIRNLRAVIGDVVETVDVDALSAAAADFDGDGGVAAIDDGHHSSGHAAPHEVRGKAAVVVRYKLIERVGSAGAHQ